MLAFMPLPHVTLPSHTYDFAPYGPDYKYSFKMNYILKMIYKNDIFRPLAAEEIFWRTNYEGAQRPMDFSPPLPSWARANCSGGPT